ncbi:hypothetical protein BDZ89DRAFT_1195172 [Hymenopellis radicata]|nr:hypothetical protein BDZ89DRAFT_1195172 [Hymenopellis radicata]
MNSILIFAGLFSAVVTAFTIESYQWLEADPAILRMRYCCTSLNSWQARREQHIHQLNSPLRHLCAV